MEKPKKKEKPKGLPVDPYIIRDVDVEFYKKYGKMLKRYNMNNLVLPSSTVALEHYNDKSK